MCVCVCARARARTCAYVRVNMCHVHTRMNLYCCHRYSTTRTRDCMSSQLWQPYSSASKYARFSEFLCTAIVFILFATPRMPIRQGRKTVSVFLDDHFSRRFCVNVSLCLFFFWTFLIVVLPPKCLFNLRYFL